MNRIVIEIHWLIVFLEAIWFMCLMVFQSEVIFADFKNRNHYTIWVLKKNFRQCARAKNKPSSTVVILMSMKEAIVLLDTNFLQKYHTKVLLKDDVMGR